MKKIFSKKLMFVIALLSALAMMIPMAIPVSAAAPTLLTQDSAGAWVADDGYNVIGTVVRVSDNATPVIVNGTLAQLVDAANNGYANYTISENDFVNAEGSVNKKWGDHISTAFSGEGNGGSSYVTWNEGAKIWSSPTISLTDTVTATFHSGKLSTVTTHVAQGLILHWYLVDGSSVVPMGPDESPDLMSAVAVLTPATFTTFVNDGTQIDTVSGYDGKSTVQFSSVGEESIKIVVVPDYPGTAQELVTPEVTTYNFKTREMEVVPQVRWAGEKIVLEANFGLLAANANLDNYTVKFSLSNDSPGLLSAIGPGLLNVTNTTQTVWAPIDNTTGLASVILESANQGQVDVNATLYYDPPPTTEPIGDIAPYMLNQQQFTVYYLKLESLVISDVIGKRALYNEDGILISHKDGYWTEENPWDETLDYETVFGDDNDTLNVSQDALVRARVKGWFTNANPTTREAGFIDIGTQYGLALPEGRYVLPDDWAMLAGPTNRIHWDIMDAPNDNVVTHIDEPKGPYYNNDLPGDPKVAEYPVIGPFSPGIEVMTDTGWAVGIVSTDPLRPNKTVVPNTVIDSWDAPMPPAKIIFELQLGSIGFFKDAFKDTIYYHGSSSLPGAGPYTYTAPFYYVNIPAHEAIPPVTANGGYDWDSFGFNNAGTYGPYPFWQIINEPDGVVTPEDAAHPTKVEVYSDNHGEAMVYLNGDANLDLFDGDSSADLPFGYEVGKSWVKAWADYPYFRTHQAIYSNTVVKTWLWGGMVLGVDGNQEPAMVLVAGKSNNPASDDYIVISIDPGTGLPYDPVNDGDAQGVSKKHVVWVWATDRDGMQAGVLDTQVDWVITGASSRFYNGSAFTGINVNEPHSYLLEFTGLGFLSNPGHEGVRALGLGVTVGTSWLKAPTAAEAGIFYKFYNPTMDPDGLQPTNFAVAAIEVFSDATGTVNVSETLTGPEYAIGGYPTGSIMRATNFLSTAAYPLDDPVVLGDANLDGMVNMMDITAVERIILGMNQTLVAQADANHNQVIDMGDVIRIEKTYLGIE